MKRAWHGLGAMDPELSADKISNRRTSDQRRGQIAAAALVCLTKVGYAGLTARKVAAEAGISLGHLTYHYDTMEAVLAAAYQLVAAQLAPLDVTVTGETPAERLEAYLRAVYAPEQLTDAALRLRIDLWSAAQTNPAIAQIEADLHAQMRAKIEQHLTAISDPWKTGRIPMVEGFVLATLDGLWLEYMRHRDVDAVHAAIEAMVLFARMRLGGT
jgi:TetR/AcrR family transcriptional repressor of bet genes